MITLPYQGIVNQVVDFYQREKVYRPRVVQTSLFFRDKAFGLEELPFDMLIDESHSIEFDIAEHAVENGSSVSDHIRERLRSVQVTGFFTNHPVGGKQSGYVGGEDDEGNAIVRWSVDPVSINGVEAKGNVALTTKFEKLKEIARERKRVRLVTALEVYDEMVIESVKYDRGPQDGESIKFVMKLREVRTAEVKTSYREGVKPAPPPKTQETDAGKKMSENEKDGKVTGSERTTEQIKTAIKGEFIGAEQ